MKKTTVLITLMAVLIGGLTFAGANYTIDDLTQFNFASIYLNNKLILEKNSDMESNGLTLPSSILFKDTTYVPLRFLSEQLGLSVNWDGNVRLGSQVVNTINPQVIDVAYSNSIKIDGIPINVKAIYIEDAQGNVIRSISYQIENGTIALENLNHFALNSNYTLFLVREGAIDEIRFKTSGVKKDSFAVKNDRWELLVPANSMKGFHYPYIISIPRYSDDISADMKRTKNRILAEGSNEFLSLSEDQQLMKVLSEYSNYYASHIGRIGSYITVVSTFPRPSQDGLLYTHSLDRDTLFGGYEYLNSLGRGNLYRIDIQFDKMLEDAMTQLKSAGKEVEEKVFLIGFSASSDFATRFNFTHPDRAKAIVVNSAPTLPLTKLDGHTLNFPLGVADIGQLTGKPFDVEKYKSVPQFWHTGDRDTNDGTYFTDGWGDYGNNKLHHNQEGIDYRKIFGDDIVKRRAYIETVLNEAGFDNIHHRTYAGVEHSWNEEILYDAIEFLKLNQ